MGRVRKKQKAKPAPDGGLGYVSFRQPISSGDALVAYFRLLEDFEEQEERFKLSQEIYFKARGKKKT